MTTNHIKAILTSLRAMVIKMLPAYKFYLGSTTETTTTQICHGVMSVKKGQTQGRGALTIDDMSFAGFVEGETYTVVLNGVSGEYVAKLFNDDVMVTNIAEFENPPEDFWAAGFAQVTCAYIVSGTYANATISISQTKTVTAKKYQAKKLDKSLLPDGVESGIEAATTKAATALSAAQAAQDTANEAISSANTAQATANTAQTTADAAQTTANTAQTTANTAKSTADTAKSTADTAKSTADAALPKSGGAVSGKINFPRNYSDGLSVGLSITSYINSKVLNNILSAGVDQTVDKQIESVVTWMDGITIYSPNKISNFKTVTISAGGNRLDFSDYINKPITIGAKDIILSSSTANSTKKLRITVDDTGTLKATEVTDA